MADTYIKTNYLLDFLKQLTDPRLSYLTGIRLIEFADLDRKVIEKVSLRDFTNNFEKFIDHYGYQPISEIELDENKLVVVFYLQLTYEDFEGVNLWN
jgi:hypothetical protein